MSMHYHFHHMMLQIGFFIFVYLFSVLFIFYYRRCKGGVFLFMPALERALLHTHFIKLSFICLATYFVLWTVYMRTGISCDMLDPAAQCECYALESIYQNRIFKRIHWAHNGLRQCPDSTYFVEFLTTYKHVR